MELTERGVDRPGLQQLGLEKTGLDRSEPLHDVPDCPECGEKMRFSCIEMEKHGFVHRVYECKKCRNTQSFVTAPIGRFNSASIAFQSGRAMEAPSVGRPGHSFAVDAILPRHLPEPAQDVLLVESCLCKIAGAAERDGTGVTEYLPLPLRGLDRCRGSCAFDGFPGDQAAVDEIKGERKKMSDFSHDGCPAAKAGWTVISRRHRRVPFSVRSGFGGRASCQDGSACPGYGRIGR